MNAFKLMAGVISLALLLAACGAEDGQSSAEAPDAGGQSISGAGSLSGDETGVVNPMQEYDTPDFTDAAGFSVAGYPETEDIRLERCYLIAGKVAELRFTFEESTVGVLRVAKDTGEDISGVYETFEEESTDDYGGVTVTYHASAGGPYLVTWTRDGYACSLYFAHAPMGLVGGVMDSFVEGVHAVETAQ